MRKRVIAYMQVRDYGMMGLSFQKILEKFLEWHLA